MFTPVQLEKGDKHGQGTYIFINGSTASSDTSSSNSGDVYVFKRSGTSWSQIAYIKAVNADEDDRYGFVDLDNSTIVVGVQNEDSNQSSITNGTSASANNDYLASGATYVYRFH